MPDAGFLLRREKVALGSLEEVHDGLVFERWRIGEVDHDLCAAQGPFEPLAGDGVDARIWRGRENLVTARAQNGDGLRTDQAGAADDYDLHDLPSLPDDWRPLKGRCRCEKTHGASSRAFRRQPERRQKAFPPYARPGANPNAAVPIFVPLLLQRLCAGRSETPGEAGRGNRQPRF